MELTGVRAGCCDTLDRTRTLPQKIWTEASLESFNSWGCSRHAKGNVRSIQEESGSRSQLCGDRSPAPQCVSRPPQAQTVTTSLDYQAPLLPQSAGEAIRVTEVVPL